MTSHTLLSSVRKGHDDLFIVPIGNLEIVFRLPSYKQALQYANVLELVADDNPMKPSMYEFIFKTHVEDDWLANHDNELLAGIPESVARLILMLSGADSSADEYTKELLEMYREVTPSSSIMFMKRTICGTFSGYTFQDLDKLNYQELLSTFIQAEQYLLENEIIKERFSYTINPQQNSALDFNQLVQDNRDLQKAESSTGPRQKHWTKR